MKNNVFNILKKELRETIRDRKSLMMMFVIPFMVPLIVIGLSLYFETNFTSIILAFLVSPINIKNFENTTANISENIISFISSIITNNGNIILNI